MPSNCLVFPFTLLLFISRFDLFDQNQTALNDKVIIGILAQPSNDGKHQYIAASYVKFVESAGGRVVPIFMDQPMDYYDKLLKQINGILLPGGSAKKGYYSVLFSRVFTKLLDESFKINRLYLENNSKSVYFPVWATCLSFELLISHMLKNEKWQDHCGVKDVSLNLDFVNHTSRLFNPVPNDVPNIVNITQQHSISANYHRICLNVSEFQKHPVLTKNFSLITQNTYNNRTFVSTIEHKLFPIYATQWHPEKNNFEFLRWAHIKHDRYAVLVSQYMANFFINEARRNQNHFENDNEEVANLIYNFSQYRKYTGFQKKSSFEEVFLLPMK